MDWAPGDVLLWCYRREARPMRVVADDENGLVAWLAPGTRCLTAVPTDGRAMRDRPPAEMFTTTYQFAVQEWQGAGNLRIAPPGAAYSAWLFRKPDGSGDFWGWYGNLEDPLRRSEVGVHTIDHVLDVWIDEHGATHWKDEDELEAAVAVGRFTAEEAAEFHAEGARVLAAMEERRYPFDDTWLAWQPDPAWETPALPEWLLDLVGQDTQDLLPLVMASR